MNATKKQAVDALITLQNFITPSQLSAIADLMRTPEKQFFFDNVVEMETIVKGMPVTYEQDGKGDDAVAYLHYFKGAMDFYITELDVMGPPHTQAYGYTNIGYGGELGYISIHELIINGVELDLHWDQRTLKEIKEK